MNSKQSLYAFTNHPNQQTVMDEITNALKSLKMPGMAHYWTTITEAYTGRVRQPHPEPQ